jgi:hypothetical protein
VPEEGRRPRAIRTAGVIEEDIMSGNRIRAVVVVIAALLPAGALAEQTAGQVLWLSGLLQSVGPDGAAKRLAKGDAVRQGDTVRTGPNSHAHLLMNDQGLIALRPESSLRVAVYAYDGRKDGSELARLELLKGGMRSITGAIGQSRKEHYKLETQTASIGIRGTDHETYVVPGSGTYNRVTLGGTYLRTAQGRIELSPGETGFAGLSATPALVARTPEFMHLAALHGPNSGPGLRAGAPGDERRMEAPSVLRSFNGKAIGHGRGRPPERAATPVLPAQTLGENRGWGKGGRCGGPCADKIK